jgi:hypothetical protein
MREILDTVNLPKMVGIVRTHHVYSSPNTSNGVFFRQLSCHCRLPLVCDCYDPQLWRYDGWQHQNQSKNVQVGQYVSVVYDEDWHLGKVVSVEGSTARITYMKQSSRNK